MPQGAPHSLCLYDLVFGDHQRIGLVAHQHPARIDPDVLIGDDMAQCGAGLDGGADDYMTKPFAIEELLARIRLVLKKRGGAVSEDKSHLGIGKLHMDVQRYEVSYDGQQIELTHREFELLRVLLENKNIVISRDTLLEKVCGYDYMGETNIIDVYVRYLRSKIDDVYQVKIILFLFQFVQSITCSYPYIGIITQ